MSYNTKVTKKINFLLRNKYFCYFKLKEIVFNILKPPFSMLFIFQIASINNPMFEVYSRDYTPETFGELDGLDVSDFILDFICLKKYHHEKLKNISPEWNLHLDEDFVVFYILDCTVVPKITTSVKISNVLLLSVFLNGREMDTADLSWIIPLSGKVNRWSQLELLLHHFSNRKDVSVSC